MKPFSFQVGPPGAEMPRGYRCSETELTIFDCSLFNGSEAWETTMDWLRFHDMDPMTMPAEQTVVRDLANRRVIHEVFIFDENGELVLKRDEDGDLIAERRRAYSQGETEPLAIPARTLARPLGVRERGDGSMSDARVTYANVELRDEETFTVTVVRLWGRIASEPRAVDVPKDFRDALRKWLDAAETGVDGEGDA